MCGNGADALLAGARITQVIALLGGWIASERICASRGAQIRKAAKAPRGLEMEQHCILSLRPPLGLIVEGALADPCPDGVAVADR